MHGYDLLIGYGLNIAYLSVLLKPVIKINEWMKQTHTTLAALLGNPFI